MMNSQPRNLQNVLTAGLFEALSRCLHDYNLTATDICVLGAYLTNAVVDDVILIEDTDGAKTT